MSNPPLIFQDEELTAERIAGKYTLAQDKLTLARDNYIIET